MLQVDLTQMQVAENIAISVIVDKLLTCYVMSSVAGHSYMGALRN